MTSMPAGPRKCSQQAPGCAVAHAKLARSRNTLQTLPGTAWMDREDIDFSRNVKQRTYQFRSRNHLTFDWPDAALPVRRVASHANLVADLLLERLPTPSASGNSHSQVSIITLPTGGPFSVKLPSRSRCAFPSADGA